MHAAQAVVPAKLQSMRGAERKLSLSGVLGSKNRRVRLPNFVIGKSCAKVQTFVPDADSDASLSDSDGSFHDAEEFGDAEWATRATTPARMKELCSTKFTNQMERHRNVLELQTSGYHTWACLPQEQHAEAPLCGCVLHVDPSIGECRYIQDKVSALLKHDESGVAARKSGTFTGGENCSKGIVRDHGEDVSLCLTGFLMGDFEGQPLPTKYAPTINYAGDENRVPIMRGDAADGDGYADWESCSMRGQSRHGHKAASVTGTKMSSKDRFPCPESYHC